MLNIIGRRRLYYLISLILIVPGLVSLAIPPGLQLAVDFTGGTLWELQFERAASPADVKSVFSEHDLGDSIVQTSGERDILVRSKEISSEGDQKSTIAAALRSRIGPFVELRFESVGPVVGQEIAGRAVQAVALAALGILLYIAWAFRHVEHPIRYGVCAIIALLHDALLVLGVFSILGRLFHIEIDALFVTAILTVIGFSVHDTIVVFDRIRENMRRMNGQPFESIVNHSLAQTLGRSLATSLTVVFTLTALVLFGGVTTRIFALTLLIGIVSGTYSSIFNASALLVSWENGEIGRFARRTPARAT
ncbi:MAG: protein translocase subunit SecF [Chloroflexota bacterium]|nr:MAG: protein translocase subunit SecF [Chloroflexota bacterium]